MAFTITVNMGGNAVPGVAALTAGLDKATDAAGRARDSMGRYAKTAGEAGEAGKAAGEKAAAGQAKAKAAADDHGDSITRLIHLAEAYIAIHQFEAIIDGYIEVRNKINAVSESHENLNGLMEETFKIAQETRSEWDSVGATYQRLANAGRSLGVSQRQILDLTEELSMGMRLSGSSSREAQMTMMELTHAFTVGTLTGREFRVMMKDAPALMHELQVVSGKTGAEFAEMGKHGKFTAQTIMEWFTKAGPAIREKFADTLPTISEGFTMIKNSAEKFFGSAAVGTGLMGQLSAAMKFVADHFDAIGKTALAVGEALIGLFVIEKIIVLVKALTVAIAANPLGLILTAVAVGISLLRQFGDQINTHVKVWTNVDGVFVTVKDDLDALWTQLKRLGAEIMDFLGEAWKALTQAFSDGLDNTGMEFSLHNAIRLVSGFVGAVRELFQIMKDDSDKVWALLSVGIVKAMEAAANGAIRAIEAIAAAPRRALFDALNKTGDKRLDATYAAGIKQDIDWAVNAPRIRKEVEADLKYGQYYAGVGDPNQHYGTKDEVFKELNRRMRLRYEGYLGDEYEARGLNRQGDDPRNGASGRLFGDIHIPVDKNVEAMAGQAWDRMGEAAKRAMTDFDKLEHEIAANRVQGGKAAGYVSDTKGKADAAGIDDKALHALEKLKNELRGILEQTNPVVAAQEKLAHAQDILTKATQTYDPVAHKMVLTQVEARDAMENYTRKLEDALHPHDAWVRKQLDAMGALKNTTEATQDAAKAQAYLDYAREHGFVPTDKQIEQNHHLAVAEREHVAAMQAQQSILEGINGPAKTYALGIESAGKLLHEGAINAEQYMHATDAMRASLLAATPEGKTFAGGLEAAWLKAKADAEAFGATVANMVVSDVEKLGDSLVTMANGGAVSWTEMVDSMIQDLERLALRMAIIGIINAIEPGLGSAAALVPGVNAPVTDPSQVHRMAPSGSANSTPPIIVQNVTHVHNHIDKSIPMAAIDSPMGHRQIVNVMRANQGSVRSYSGNRR